ncbi:MAG: hypothetical protein V7679_00180 [Parasphingorhabdus sp.]
MNKNTEMHEGTNKSVKAKAGYQTPEFKEFGVISNIFGANSGNGFDGSGGFPNDTLS